MSGTSMAAPHVSGGAALVLQRVARDFPDLTGMDKVKMAKNLLMSTATPLLEKGPKNSDFGLENFTSPRREGAGVMNLYGAVTTPAIVTDSLTDESKVNLHEIGDVTTFPITITNYGDERVAYQVYGTVGSDLVMDDLEDQYDYPLNFLETGGIYKNGTISNDAPWTGEYPISFETEDGTVIDSVYRTVYVDAHSTLTIHVTLDLTDAVDWYYNKPLDVVYPNGAFIEGFIRFVPTDDENIPAIGLPYMGFYGKWDQAPIFDESVYNKNGRMPYYGITDLAWFDEANGKYLSLIHI